MDWYKMREKVYEIIDKQNSVDKLMRDKVDPYIIIDELPLPVQIGEKVIYIGNLNLKNESEFFKKCAEILGNLGLQNIFVELLSDGMKLMKYMKIHDELRKKLSRLICDIVLKQQKWYFPKNDKTYKLNKCSKSYMLNNLSKEKLVQIVFLIYLYNYDSLGKSLALVANKMGVKAISQTYMWTWLKSMAGVNGSFLIDQLPNLDWYNKEEDPKEKEVKENG